MSFNEKGAETVINFKLDERLFLIQYHLAVLISGRLHRRREQQVVLSERVLVYYFILGIWCQ